VKKIVILANESGPDHGLLGLLYATFPDCEVSIVPKQIETVEGFPGDRPYGPCKGHNIGTKNNRYFYL
jgi:hypothetical protein